MGKKIILGIIVFFILLPVVAGQIDIIKYADDFYLLMHVYLKNDNWTVQNLNLSHITGCSEALETDANGKIICGIDQTGAGLAYDLNISADSGTGTILDSEILTFEGSGIISTSISGNTLTISGTGGGNKWNISTSKWLYNNSDNLEWNETLGKNYFMNRSNWSTIDDYPSACISGDFVTEIGDSLTCATPSYTTDTNCSASGSCSTIIYFDNESSLNVNSSDYWGLYNTANTTQFENQGGVLHIIESWLTSFINSWFGGKTTDELAEGSSNLYDNQSWNESHADTKYIQSESDPLWTANQTNYYNKTDTESYFVNRTDWTTHDDYPASCSSGSFVRGIGDTLTCATDDDQPDDDSEVPDNITINTTFDIVIHTNTKLCLNADCTNYLYNNGTHSIWR